MRTGLRIALTICAALACAPVLAAETDPSVWLRQTYDLYRRAEKNPDLLKTSALEVVERRASRSLAALFKRENDCVAKSHEICALDWDFIVNGQDWTLRDVNVGPLKIAGEKATVSVTFKNFNKPNANVYHFVREDGDWKVDDIETRDGDKRTTHIAKLLKDYKDY